MIRNEKHSHEAGRYCMWPHALFIPDDFDMEYSSPMTLEYSSLHDFARHAYMMLVTNKCRDSESYKEHQFMIVDVMKDNKLKLRGLHASHTLGCSGDWNT